MAAVVGVSLRRRLAATALSGVCLQVSRGSGGRGEAGRVRGLSGSDVAAERPRERWASEGRLPAIPQGCTGWLGASSSVILHRSPSPRGDHRLEII